MQEKGLNSTLLIEIQNSELQRIPNNIKTISLEDAKSVLKLLDKLEEDDDVQQVFHNMKLTEEILTLMEGEWWFLLFLKNECINIR